MKKLISLITLIVIMLFSVMAYGRVLSNNCSTVIGEYGVSFMCYSKAIQDCANRGSESEIFNCIVKARNRFDFPQEESRLYNKMVAACSSRMMSAYDKKNKKQGKNRN